MYFIKPKEQKERGFCLRQKDEAQRRAKLTTTATTVHSGSNNGFARG